MTGRLDLSAKERAALFKKVTIVGTLSPVILSADHARVVATTHLREGIWGGAHTGARRLRPTCCKATRLTHPSASPQIPSRRYRLTIASVIPLRMTES